MNSRESTTRALADVVDTLLHEWSAAVEPTLKGPDAVLHRMEVRRYRALTDDLLGQLNQADHDLEDEVAETEELADGRRQALDALLDAARAVLRRKRGCRERLRLEVGIAEVAA